MNHNSYRKTAELLLFIFIAAIYFYALTYRAFGFFFDRDDIHNLSWGHIISPFEFIRDTLNIANMATIHTYRPVGALFYNLCYQAFGLNFASFHLARTALHLVNASLVFLLIRSFVKDGFPTFSGALFFTFHVAAIAAYWQFSSIFDVLCATFMFLSFLFYIRAEKVRSFWMLASFFTFFLACRTKEMAFMQPIILLFYEAYKAQSGNSKIVSIQNAKKLLPFFFLALLLGTPKIYAGFSVEKQNPYALEFSSFIDGVKFYGNSLFRRETTSLLGPCIAILLGGVALILRNRTLQFAYAYVLISIMPVLLLTNHRHGFYGYIPLFGVSLYVAELFNTLQNYFSRQRIARRAFLYMLISLFFMVYSIRNINEKRIAEENYLESGKKVQNFIKLMQPLNPKGESQFLFDSAPADFDDVVLTSSIHLLFHDWTITTQVIPDCEKLQGSMTSAEVYCISFTRQKVYRIPVRGKL